MKFIISSHLRKGRLLRGNRYGVIIILVTFYLCFALLEFGFGVIDILFAFLLCNGLFCQFQKLVIEIGDFFEVRIVDGTQLLKKLQSFPLLKFYIDIFDIRLQRLTQLLVVRVFVNFGVELLHYFF